MKSKEQAQWARGYQVALRTYLEPGSAADLKPALRLGRQAVRFGMATLVLARIHKQTLTKLEEAARSSARRSYMAKHAKEFFNATLGPTEKTHHAALQTKGEVHQLAKTLRQRTAQSVVSNRNLAHGIAQRRASEVALKKSGDHRAQLMQSSLQLRKRVRKQTHQMLAKMEQEWMATSRQLQSEIAQTLLAIHIRLLTLKNGARRNTDSLKKEIVGTQRLVKHSVYTVRKLAHELGVAHEG